MTDQELIEALHADRSRLQRELALAELAKEDLLTQVHLLQRISAKRLHRARRAEKRYDRLKRVLHED